MSKSVKTGVVAIALATCLTSLSYAKVVPVHEYQLKQLTETKVTPTCASYNYMNEDEKKETSNATCNEKRLFDGTKCWTCSCPSVYKYKASDCTTTGYKKPTNTTAICNDGKEEKYSSCECADGYIQLPSGYDRDMFTYNGTIAQGKGPQCYRISDFKCKSPYLALGNNSRTFNLDPGPYGGGKTVTYKTQKPFDESTLECVYALDYDKTNIFVSAQTSNSNLTCHEQHTYTPPLFTQATLYYYNGCSTENMCYTAAPTSPCISYKSHSFNGEICYKTVGCLDDPTLIDNNTRVCTNQSVGHVGFGTTYSIDGANKVQCKVMSCVSANKYYVEKPGSSFNYISATKFGLTCYKVTGCNTNNNCQEDEPPAGAIYETETYKNKTCYCIIGCATGEYDYSTYWDGYLAWWK